MDDFFSRFVLSAQKSINYKDTNAIYECILSHKGCHMFLSWIFFNGLQIGGWLMLGIVLSGIMVLAVTHVLGIRNMRRPQQRQLSRILWVEAVTKSRLARFV